MHRIKFKLGWKDVYKYTCNYLSKQYVPGKIGTGVVNGFNFKFYNKIDNKLGNCNSELHNGVQTVWFGPVVTKKRMTFNHVFVITGETDASQVYTKHKPCEIAHIFSF